MDSKIKAAKLGLKVAELKRPEQDEGPTLDPIFQPFFSLLWDYCNKHRTKTGQPISQIEAIGLISSHMRSCPTSPMSAANLGFIEVIDDFQE